MILIHKFARVYSYFPQIVLMLMFRLLLYGEQQHHQHVNATKIAAVPPPPPPPSSSSSFQPQSKPTAADKNQHHNSGNVARAENIQVKRNASASSPSAGGDSGSGNVAEIFIAVIYPKSKETIFSRVIKQTVTSLSEDFTSATSLRVVPHYTAIADTEGYNIRQVQEVCEAWNHKPIIAAVVFSTFKSGFGHVLTSLHNNIPVLWATGEIQAGYFERAPLSRFDVRLDPGSYEVLRSLRSLLLATHWHAFTVIHTTTLLASQLYQDIISQPPLLPTILRFRPDSTSYYIFRLLSDVSKSTKGVIVLICEGIDAKRVIEESKKLNMVNGDFVWLWIDTSAMLIKDKTIRLEKVSKEINFVVETRKVRHAASAAGMKPTTFANHRPGTTTTTDATAPADTSNIQKISVDGGNANRTADNKMKMIPPTTTTAAVAPPPAIANSRITATAFASSSSSSTQQQHQIKSKTDPKPKRLQRKYYYNNDDSNDIVDNNYEPVDAEYIDNNEVAAAGAGSLNTPPLSHSSSNTTRTTTGDGWSSNDIPPPPPSASSLSNIYKRERDAVAVAAAAAAASFDALMKHHFLLYRKKAKRINTNNKNASNVTRASTVATSMPTTHPTVSKQLRRSSSSSSSSSFSIYGRNGDSKNVQNTIIVSAADINVSRSTSSAFGGGGGANNSKQRTASQMPSTLAAVIPSSIHRNRYHYNDHPRGLAIATATTTATPSSSSSTKEAAGCGGRCPASGGRTKRNVNENDKYWPSASKAIASELAFIEKITVSAVAAGHSREDENGRRRRRRRYEKYQQLMLRLPQPLPISATPLQPFDQEMNFSKMAAQLDVEADADVGVAKRKAVHSSSKEQDSAATSTPTPETLAASPSPYDFDVPIFVDNNSTPPVTVKNKTVPEMPVGILSLQLIPPKVDKNYVKSALRLLINTLKDVIVRYGDRDTKLSKLLDLPRISCFDFFPLAHGPNSIMEELTQNLKRTVREAMAGRYRFNDTHLLDEAFNSSLAAKFKILNLIPDDNRSENKTALESRKWRTIGHMVGEDTVHLETIVWPGGDIVPVSTGRGSRSIFRIVTAFSPPFVMIGELDEDGQCLRGIECHQFLTSDKDNLTLLFNEMERTDEEDEVNLLDRLQLEKRHTWGDMDIRQHHPGHKFKTNCCYGLSMDLLENVAEELEFDFQLYIVADGLFGTKTISDNGEPKWNGIMGDLVSGAAHLSFSALSVSSSRAQAIDFSAPYFFSGVSFLAAPKESTDIPLMAFLLPFSSNLWIAIFTSLHVTAAAVAIYEWLSPFGLNPWGRQRSKNFGVASALWVMWGLLCGHLVQFKAPKSWPNKFLINVWGGFSVIFIASYTANIAALIAGLFFHTAVGDHHDRSLLSQRVGAPKASAAEYYVRTTNQILWDHMQRYSVISVAEGVQLLKNGSLDILIADTPILDYYRATDHGCKLQRIGDTINEDTYAIGMTKGFPLKDSISAVIAKYSSNGYMDILQEKWYGGLPCFKLATDMAQPRPLGVAAVAGVFLMLGCGVLVGCLILFSEHLFYKYTLPSLRKKPKSSMWKSRNVMFFSQKLYRFINCVELVSPHHAARELVHTLRQGQITSLFQKSVRRKEHEQRQQQQKSKAQFFEMIQEIRRVQQEERKDGGGGKSKGSSKTSPRKKYYGGGNKNPQILLSPTGLLKHRNRLSPARLDFARRLSKDVFRSKSSGNLDVRRISSDMNVATGRFFDFYSAQAIGRRLSHGTTADNSPPDLNAVRRASQFFKDDSFFATATAAANPSPSCGSEAPLPPSTTDYGGLGSGHAIASSPSDPNLAKSPKSPTSASAPSSSVSSNVFSPGGSGRNGNSFFSRDIGPLAARKFGNVDSSSFRGLKNKPANKINAPKVTINNQEFFGYDGVTSPPPHCDDNDDTVDVDVVAVATTATAAVSTDNDDYDDDDYHYRDKARNLQQTEYSGAYSAAENDLVKSAEHFIEIVIPTTATDGCRTPTQITRNTNEIYSSGDHAPVNESAAPYEYQSGDCGGNTNVIASAAKNNAAVADAVVAVADARSTTTPLPEGAISRTQQQQLPQPQVRCDEYDTKPKIILHLPPRKTKKTRKSRRPSNSDDESVKATAAAAVSATSATTAGSPLQRLSRDELISLLKLSEKDLKENLVKALKEKEST